MIQFNELIAEDIGVNAAILYEDIRKRINENTEANIFKKGERVWAYRSAEQLHKKYPFLSVKQIKLAIKKLTDQGYLDKQFDIIPKSLRVTWYAIPETIEGKIWNVSKNAYL